MSEENLEVGVPETAEAAEAAPVADAPAAEAPAEAESSLAAETASQPEAEAPASFPSADEFGWDDWNGSHEAFPEQLQPWAQKFSGYYDNKMKTMTADMDRSKEIYDALLGGQEDPRLAEYQQQLTAWESRHSGLHEQHRQLTEEYQEFQRVVSEAIEQEADEYAKAFQEANPSLFEDGELKDTFVSLLNEEWSVESAAVAARLPPMALEVARKAKADGVPDNYALRLAEKAKSQPAKPRPGAQITSGASTPARSPEQAPLEPDTRAMSLRDFRTLAARNAIQTKKRRA